jgi:hypothetical protein
LATLRIPRGSSPVLSVTIYEGKQGESPVMNLTGVPLAIIDSDLPFVPTIVATDPIGGVAQITFPDTSPMPVARSFKMRIRVGAPGAPATFTTPYIEVMAT